MKREYNVVLSAEALADLKNLLNYIVESSGFQRTAIKFIERIERRCQRIADMPFAGRDRGDLYPGLRTVPFESVIIAYVIKPSSIRILKVVHAAQDYETILKDGS